MNRASEQLDTIDSRLEAIGARLFDIEAELHLQQFITDNLIRTVEDMLESLGDIITIVNDDITPLIETAPANGAFRAWQRLEELEQCLKGFIKYSAPVLKDIKDTQEYLRLRKRNTARYVNYLPEEDS